MINAIFHIGAIIGAGRDVKSAVADLISHKAFISADWKKVISDLETLVDDGIFAIPGISGKDVDAVLEQLKAQLPA